MYHKFFLGNATDAELEKWAADPNCDNKDECAEQLRRRRGEAAKPAVEISADAKYIASKISGSIWGVWWATLILGILAGVLIALVTHTR
jgi:hypothetical protein